MTANDDRAREIIAGLKLRDALADQSYDRKAANNPQLARYAQMFRNTLEYFGAERIAELQRKARELGRRPCL